MKMHLLISQMDPTGAANALLLSSDDEDEDEYAGDEVASAFTPPSTRTPADQYGTISSMFLFLRPLGPREGGRLIRATRAAAVAAAAAVRSRSLSLSRPKLRGY